MNSRMEPWKSSDMELWKYFERNPDESPIKISGLIPCRILEKVLKQILENMKKGINSRKILCQTLTRKNSGKKTLEEFWTDFGRNLDNFGKIPRRVIGRTRDEISTRIPPKIIGKIAK